MTADDARSDARRPRVLAKACHVLIERAVHWSAEDVRAVLSLLSSLNAHPDAGFVRFAQLATAIDAATRDRRPGALPLDAFAAYCDPHAAAPAPALDAFAPEGFGPRRKSLDERRKPFGTD